MFMKLKSFVVFALFAIGLTGATFAQKGHGRSGAGSPEMKEKRARFMEERKTFINENAGLTEKEASEFWNLEMQKNKEMKAVKSDMPKGGKITKEDIEKLSDEEAEKKVTSKFEAIRKRVEIEERFSLQQMKALGPKKFLLTEKAENEFKQFMMKKMREDRTRPANAPTPPTPPSQKK